MSFGVVESGRDEDDAAYGTTTMNFFITESRNNAVSPKQNLPPKMILN